MAEIIYAVNQTGSDATIIDMGEVVVPGSGQVDLGALYPAEFVYRSDDLKQLINQNILLMSPDGTSVLNQTDSIEFVRQEVHYLSRDATSIIGTGVLGTTPIDKDVIQYQQSTGLWEPSQFQGLPSGSVNDTLRYDGGSWAANSSVTSDGTNLVVSGDQTTVGVGYFSNHIQVGDVASDPYTPQQGDVRWDGTAFLGYDGINWSTLSHTATYRYSISTGVPTAGTRYMVTGDGVATSAAGDRISRDSRIRTITVEVQQIDTARSFDIEILSTPSGTPTLLSSLTLPVSTKGAIVTSLDVAVSAGTEIGARIVRATGTGQSSWNEANVTVGMIQ
jgi:hypothetical protein